MLLTVCSAWWRFAGINITIFIFLSIKWQLNSWKISTMWFVNFDFKTFYHIFTVDFTTFFNQTTAHVRQWFSILQARLCNFLGKGHSHFLQFSNSAKYNLCVYNCIYYSHVLKIEPKRFYPIYRVYQKSVQGIVFGFSYKATSNTWPLWIVLNVVTHLQVSFHAFRMRIRVWKLLHFLAVKR